MYKHLLILLLLIGFAVSASAQTSKHDSTRTKRDQQNLHRDSIDSKRFVPKVTREKMYRPDSNHSPHTAVLRSLIIPGWGQLYNHQWWKVPIIYGGLGLLAYAYTVNQNTYGPNLIVAKYIEHGVPPKPGQPQYALYQFYIQNNVPSQSVYDLVDGARRDRDLCILGFFGGWGIQLIDAYIDAKFQHSYTMDTDFSFKIAPTVINQESLYADNFNSPIIPGIKLTFTLR